MKMNDEEIFSLTKRVLGDFLSNYLIRKHSNPGETNYRKTLTTKEEKIIYVAKTRLPGLQKILASAITSIQNEEPNLLNPEYIKQHFSECAIALECKAFSIYLKNEENLFLSIIEEWVSQNGELLNNLYNKSPVPQDFSKQICKHFYPMVQRMEFNASQTRKARGGKTFEHIVQYLLKSTGISCERPSGDARKILKRIDLVVPDQDRALKRPDEAYFLSCKRTLRERWKQTIPERKPSWRVFLITLDESLPEDKAKEIDALGMIVYVRDELKERTYLQRKEWVRKLSNLPKDLGEMR